MAREKAVRVLLWPVLFQVFMYKEQFCGFAEAQAVTSINKNLDTRSSRLYINCCTNICQCLVQFNDGVARTNDNARRERSRGREKNEEKAKGTHDDDEDARTIKGTEREKCTRRERERERESFANAHFTRRVAYSL